MIPVLRKLSCGHERELACHVDYEKNKCQVTETVYSIHFPNAWYIVGMESILIGGLYSLGTDV
jgi:hypothetical protein